MSLAAWASADGSPAVMKILTDSDEGDSNIVGTGLGRGSNHWYKNGRSRRQTLAREVMATNYLLYYSTETPIPEMKMRNTLYAIGLAAMLLAPVASAVEVRIMPRNITATVEEAAEMTIKRIPVGQEFSLTVNKGQDMSFYTLVWFKDGVVLEGESGQSITRPMASTDLNGIYTVKMSSPCATAMSMPIRVIVGPTAFPINTRIRQNDAVAGRLGETTDEATGLREAQPNPVMDRTMINFVTNEASPVTLKVVDMNGRVIATLVDENLTAGSHEVIFNTREYDMSNSMYYVVLTTPSMTDTKALMITR